MEEFARKVDGWVGNLSDDVSQFNKDHPIAGKLVLLLALVGVTWLVSLPF